jgi:uncharacterized protein
VIGRPAEWPRPKFGFARRREYVAMPDGVRLATDIYLPDTEGPVPCVLVRTPYGKRMPRLQVDAEGFAAQGYAVAVQDVRGKFESEGVFSVSANDAADGDATVSWLAGRPWCTGKIGTYGCSYLGEAQLQLAARRNPHHAAAIAQSSGGANDYFGIFDGGARGLQWSVNWFIGYGSRLHPYFDPGSDPELLERTSCCFDLEFQPPPDLDYDALYRQLPLTGLVEAAGAPPSEWEDFIAREPGDPWWEMRGYLDADDRFDVPTLMIDSWYDPAVAPALRVHERMRDCSESPRARDNQYVVVSPTQHCASHTATDHTVVGERDFGDARFNHFELYLRWFARWLRDDTEAIAGLAKVHYYAMGANVWKHAPEWPPAATEQRLYLTSDGDAIGRGGSGRLERDAPASSGADSFRYDPGDPVPSHGGQMFDDPRDTGAGAREQTVIEERDDVLVYTSPPLRDDVEVTGYLRVVLFVSSDARDTDFAVKLVDVDCEGRAFNVQQGVTRARYRNGYDDPRFLEPGAIERLEVDLHATSIVFAAGHRIRIQVAGSDFPLYDRNLNTGGDNSRDTDWVTATNTVHHGPDDGSHVVLPVVGGDLALEPAR